MIPIDQFGGSLSPSIHATISQSSKYGKDTKRLPNYTDAECILEKEDNGANIRNGVPYFANEPKDKIIESTSHSLTLPNLSPTSDKSFKRDQESAFALKSLARYISIFREMWGPSLDLDTMDDFND